MWNEVALQARKLPKAKRSPLLQENAIALSTHNKMRLILMLQPFCDFASGLYHLRGSEYIPSGIYWVDVLSSGCEATLSFKKDGEEVGFANAVNNKLWNGFYESEMIPCCDLRNLSLTPVATELAA